MESRLPNLIFGQLGHLLIIISFIAVLLSMVSYIIGSNSKNTNDKFSWLSLGRLTYIVHTLSVIGAIVLLFIMLRSHLFEYDYVWKHSAKSLPFRYLFSCFWEGQEGSTLLWIFWHSILGIILIFSAKKWEAPVLAVLAGIQLLLLSMELGIYVFNYKMGNSPFMLLRETMDIPIFKMNPNYVPEDGSGLSPLLQNYWMTIHPPTLFLGFALTSVPFCFVIASLWKRDYHNWIKPVMPWMLIAFAVLGTGILMGGAWAYEALSFGGFWAWDPVENASLVPWLVLAAGLHTLLAFKHSGYSLASAYFLVAMSFLLILYSSFLTKSGVLGDSSVHSFTDMGMSGQLFVTIVACALPFIILFILRFNEIPAKKKEEASSSREFWLFIGALIFTFSALHIIMVTSVPVFNKIFNTNFAPPSDIESHYNGIQIWVGILLAIGAGFGFYLKYKKTNLENVYKTLGTIGLLSMLITAVIAYGFRIRRIDYMLLIFAGIFTVFSNGSYLIQSSSKIRAKGGALSHLGFGIMIIGILISQGRQEVISLNRYGFDYGEGFDQQTNEENVLLYKNIPEEMNEYIVTYLGSHKKNSNIYFDVKYETKDKAFVLKPNIQIDEQMGNVANPSTKRSPFSDLYTHITAAPLKDDGSKADTLIIDTYTINVGDTIRTSRGAFGILKGINPNAEVEDFEQKEGDIVVGAQILMITLDSSFYIEPKYFIREQMATAIPTRLEDLDIRIALTKIIPEQSALEITVEQTIPEYIIMKAIKFPFINLLWLGAFIMVLGILISAYNRKKLVKLEQKTTLE